MSKSSDLDKTVKRYIIDHIDASGYDQDPQTDAEKVKFLMATFRLEYGCWAIPRYGELRALTEWFQGLPSACNTAFYNSDILTLAVKWGSLPADYTDRQAEKILGNWWNLLANKTIQLSRKYGA